MSDTKLLTPPQTRRLLREAVGLLERAGLETDMLAWWGAKDDFLIDLAALMGVDDVQGIIETLAPQKRGPKPGSRWKHLEQRQPSPRVAKILARLEKGEAPQSIAKRFKITKQAVSAIRMSWRPETSPYLRVAEKHRAGTVDNRPARRIGSPQP